MNQIPSLLTSYPWVEKGEENAILIGELKSLTPLIVEEKIEPLDDDQPVIFKSQKNGDFYCRLTNYPKSESSEFELFYNDKLICQKIYRQNIRPSTSASNFFGLLIEPGQFIHLGEDNVFVDQNPKSFSNFLVGNNKFPFRPVYRNGNSIIYRNACYYNLVFEETDKELKFKYCFKADGLFNGKIAAFVNLRKFHIVDLTNFTTHSLPNSDLNPFWYLLDHGPDYLVFKKQTNLLTSGKDQQLLFESRYQKQGHKLISDKVYDLPGISLYLSKVHDEYNIFKGCRQCLILDKTNNKLISLSLNPALEYGSMISGLVDVYRNSQDFFKSILAPIILGLSEDQQCLKI